MFNWNKKEKPFASFGGFGGGGLGLARVLQNKWEYEL